MQTHTFGESTLGGSQERRVPVPACQGLLGNWGRRLGLSEWQWPHLRNTAPASVGVEDPRRRHVRKRYQLQDAIIPT